jgi:predicted nucleic acid-binding protein
MNPTRVFADAFMYIALLNPRDNFHNQALELAETLLDCEMVTSEPVLVEVLNFFSAFGPYHRRQAVELLGSLRNDDRVTIEAQTSTLFEDGLDLYVNRDDKDYSLTDCMSMTVARRMDIIEIATHDDGFRQEGFTILL